MSQNDRNNQIQIESFDEYKEILTNLSTLASIALFQNFNEDILMGFVLSSSRAETVSDLEEQNLNLELDIKKML